MSQKTPHLRVSVYVNNVAIRDQCSVLLFLQLLVHLQWRHLAVAVCAVPHFEGSVWSPDTIGCALSLKWSTSTPGLSLKPLNCLKWTHTVESVTLLPAVIYYHWFSWVFSWMKMPITFFSIVGRGGRKQQTGGRGSQRKETDKEGLLIGVFLLSWLW